MEDQMRALFSLAVAVIIAVAVAIVVQDSFGKVVHGLTSAHVVAKK